MYISKELITVSEAFIGGLTYSVGQKQKDLYKLWIPVRKCDKRKKLIRTWGRKCSWYETWIFGKTKWIYVPEHYVICQAFNG